MGKRAEGKREKRHKDPDAPKRPMSAFFMFCQEERPKVKKIHPDWKVGEIAKELGKRWEHVEKTKYEGEAARDKQRYEKEMAQYKASTLTHFFNCQFYLSTSPLYYKPFLLFHF